MEREETRFKMKNIPVLEAVLLPTQIVVTKELDKTKHIWLTALSERIFRDLGADRDRIKEIFKEKYGFTDDMVNEAEQKI